MITSVLLHNDTFKMGSFLGTPTLEAEGYHPWGVGDKLFPFLLSCEGAYFKKTFRGQAPRPPA